MDVALVVTVVFLGALVRATFGFGEAVVSMPLLALLPVPLHTSIALVGLAGLTVAALAVTTGWRAVDRPVLARLVPATIVGIPVGLVLVTVAPAALITGLLGGFLVGYGIYSLARPGLGGPVPSRWAHPSWALPFGFAAGVLGSAYNFNGVPVVVYAGLRRWDPARFRGTMQAHFLVSGALIVGSQALAGFWDGRLWLLYLFALPAIVVATVLGSLLHRHIPAARFTNFVFGLVIALGVVLVVRAA